MLNNFEIFVLKIFEIFLKFLMRQFRRAGWRALAFDIKLNVQHDLVTRTGFYQLLEMGLMFLVSIVVPSALWMWHVLFDFMG